MQKNICIKKVLQKIDKEIENFYNEYYSNHKVHVEVSEKGQSRSDATKFQDKVTEEGIAQMIAKKKGEREAIENCPIPNSVTSVCLGAFVLIEEGGLEKRYILLPEGAGVEVWDDETLDSYTVVTPNTLIGKALLGKYEGNKAVFKIGTKEKKVLIKKVW